MAKIPTFLLFFEGGKDDAVGTCKEEEDEGDIILIKVIVNVTFVYFGFTIGLVGQRGMWNKVC
jgi:hypothetical protein